MKMNLFFSALLVCMTVTTIAHADMVCKDEAGGPDHGYTVTMRGDTAVVAEESIAGTKTLAVLKCAELPVHPTPCCDRPTVTIVCSEPELRDAGYSFRVSEGGFVYRETGILSQVSIAGSTPIATTLCE